MAAFCSRYREASSANARTISAPVTRGARLMPRWSPAEFPRIPGKVLRRPVPQGTPRLLRGSARGSHRGNVPECDSRAIGEPKRYSILPNRARSQHRTGVPQSISSINSNCSRFRRRALHDLLFRLVPPHRPPLPVALDRHAGGDRHAEAELEGAVRLFGRVAHAIEEVLHVAAALVRRGAGHFIPVPPVHLLRGIADALRRVADGAVIAQRFLAHPELVVAEAGGPVEQHLLFMLQRHVHRVRHFAAVLPQVQAACHRRRFRNAQPQQLVPECELVAHVLVDIAPRIVPEEAPVDVAVRVEGHCGASPRNDFQTIFSGVISGYTCRDHCGLPCGVLRYMWASIDVILPTSSGLRKLCASATCP